MKIYGAGIYAGNRQTVSNSIHLRVSQDYKYPFMLESYYYCGPRMVAMIRSKKEKIFLDSGAFTAFMEKLKGRKEVKIDLQRYANFIKQNSDIIEVASSVDVIGQGHEQDSYDNLKKLENLLGKGVVMPVHHARDHDDWLKRYIDEGYDYIFLGGMVPESTRDLKKWLDHVWYKFLINPDGTAKVKIHGFGLTTESLMFRYPWYSVDSTLWVMTSRFGMLIMDFPDNPESMLQYQRIHFSERSPSRYIIDGWHFAALRSDEQEFILRRLDQLEAERVKDPVLEKDFEAELGVKMGFNPAALGKSYGLRDVGNLEYLRRAMGRAVDRFKFQQETLFD